MSVTLDNHPISLKTVFVLFLLMLINLIPRQYQSSIFQTCTSNNTLVVLPTGLGKTAIAMMLAARRLLVYPNSKIVFLAPTKPLVEQQMNSFKEHFFGKEFSLFTGATSPDKRHELWKSSQLIFSTPQTIENDIISGKINFSDVSALIVDEAHRASGDYAYVFLAKKYVEQAIHQRILALTASPGSDQTKVQDVMSNLYLEKIEYRKSTDKDVVKHTNQTKIYWDVVELPETFKKILSFLSSSFRSKLNKVKDFGLTVNIDLTKSGLLRLQSELQALIAKGGFSPELLQSVSLVAEAMKVQHALELAETQTIHAVYTYTQGIISQASSSKTKAVKNLARDPDFLSAVALIRDMKNNNLEHPKVDVLVNKINKIVAEKKDSKVIIFTQFRDTAHIIKEKLSCSSSLFFGQAKRNGVGFSQKKQKEVLDSFRKGNFSCLIATSVAEEGLDIPSVDHVIFYEPVPSGIRSVQRRGRTGRHSTGHVTVLVAKGTRDEVHRWVSFHREKGMYKALDTFKEAPKREQLSLKDFHKSSIKIFCDYREKGSPTLKALLDMGINIELKNLEVGDFVLSGECCVEFKNYKDFISSVIDGRLLSQLRSLSQYKKPVVLIEGEEEYPRNVNQEAIRGMIATIVLSYRISLLRTSNPTDSAKLLIALATREQESKDDTFTFHTAKPLDDKQLQEYVVSSFPGIGGALAKPMLQQFGTIKNLLNASIEDLKKVPLIGEKKAKELKRVFELYYK